MCAYADVCISICMLYRIGRTDTDDYGGLSPRGAIPKCSITVYIYMYI